MLYTCLTLQILIGLLVGWRWHMGGRRWMPRHTVFCIASPIILYILWMCFWWLLPVNLLPESWFDGRLTFAGKVFMCAPSLAFSWVLFFLHVGTTQQSRIKSH